MGCGSSLLASVEGVRLADDQDSLVAEVSSAPDAKGKGKEDGKGKDLEPGKAGGKDLDDYMNAFILPAKNPEDVEAPNSLSEKPKDEKKKKKKEEDDDEDSLAEKPKDEKKKKK